MLLQTNYAVFPCLLLNPDIFIDSWSLFSFLSHFWNSGLPDATEAICASISFVVSREYRHNEPTWILNTHVQLPPGLYQNFSFPQFTTKK